jgi:L-threonylcarbamoyladenylate synthase
LTEIGSGGLEVDRIVAHLRCGGLLGYPTETVYGLGGEPSPAVIERIRRLKGRDEGKPLLLLLPGSVPMGESPLRWGFDPPEWARRLGDLFWPGPLTLVLRDDEGRFPLGIRSSAGGVAVRVSSHPYVERLMASWGGPLISTSANRGGEPAALTADEVRKALGDAGGGDGVIIIDGGRAASSAPSTLVDCTGDRPKLLRRGAIPLDALRAALPELLDDGR